MTTEKKAKLFGLLGKNISYSFSRAYFSRKFDALGLPDHRYVNFDIDDIKVFPEIIKENRTLKGMNVTIPYKEAVISLLDEIDASALEIGAVNTIQFTKSGTCKGYNTDVIGFQKSLEKLLKPYHKNALVLGTGGASKAVMYALQQLGISSTVVSRTPETSNQISYRAVDASVLEKHLIVINCTPLGTFPNIENCPDLPYDQISENHLLYDLIYNPKETKFLSEGKQRGAHIKNGLEMLEIQAEEAWKIWNE